MRAPRQERDLKHRADNKTRTIPIPVLVRLLRAHVKRYGTTPDEQVFQTARGGILQDSGYNEVWTEARKQALTPAQQRCSPAAPTTCRAGHGVAVLLKIYAHCIDGQAHAANQRITDALITPEAEQDPGDEGDAGSEPTARNGGSEAGTGRDGQSNRSYPRRPCPVRGFQGPRNPGSPDA